MGQQVHQPCHHVCAGETECLLVALECVNECEPPQCLCPVRRLVPHTDLEPVCRATPSSSLAILQPTSGG